jgi:hypothetical protein
VTEDGHTWRRLEVLFPEDVATRRRRNVYYIDDAGLVRRHHYVSEVPGPNAGVVAHYSDEHHEFDRLLLPTRRRVYLTDDQGRAVRDPLLVRIDISDVVVS